MSTWYVEPVPCPRCGHAALARLARGLHASRLPEARAAILRGELHRVTCGACDARIDVHRALVYTDFARGHWVHVACPPDLARWAAVERDAEARFERALRHGAPAVAGLAGAFARRVVFDLDELRERLVIWDAGLDDAVVECVKLACVRERPAVRGPGERVRLRAIEAGGALVLARIASDRPWEDRATWTVPRAAVAGAAGDVATLQARFPALFAPGFVSIDRYLVGADA